ncbi:MAG: UDP-N-acetylmuramoyl-tripeptide--D-alanyl-D-alanine ligase, partial [Actinobacteria bacterium]|nr:UDP-N-acetylmuramoyl-tripeptide--D-alanyl-D-alanine ligase [Actinomycetota bacterium]
PVLALGRLARWVRTHRLTCRVVAITGSSGKTSTKDLVAQVLGRSGRTVAAVGSFNTEVGVPLTILRADETTEYLVLEMGMRGEGHIRYLCELAAPSVGILINIGSAHLGMLGSAGAIARAKGEILEGLPRDGVAIVNGDDAAVIGQTRRTMATVITFGTGPSCDVRATDLRLDDRACPAFTLHHGDRAVPVALLLHGEHSVHNALAAAAVGVTLEVPIEEIASALGASTPQSKWRMEVRESEEGWIIVNDAYNANPDSMRAALEVLASMSVGHRSWAVLGEMKELGETGEAEHEAIGRLVCDLGITRLVGIGEGARPMERACKAEGSALTEVTWVATPDEAIALLRSELTPGDVVLVKASRSIGLERLAAALMSKGRL